MFLLSDGVYPDRDIHDPISQRSLPIIEIGNGFWQDRFKELDPVKRQERKEADRQERLYNFAQEQAAIELARDTPAPGRERKLPAFLANVEPGSDRSEPPPKSTLLEGQKKDRYEAGAPPTSLTPQQLACKKYQMQDVRWRFMELHPTFKARQVVTITLGTIMRPRDGHTMLLGKSKSHPPANAFVSKADDVVVQPHKKHKGYPTTATTTIPRLNYDVLRNVASFGKYSSYFKTRPKGS